MLCVAGEEAADSEWFSRDHPVTDVFLGGARIFYGFVRYGVRLYTAERSDVAIICGSTSL